MTVDNFMAKYYAYSYYRCLNDTFETVTLLKRPRALCADGFSISIQGGKNAYCEPRKNLYSGYKEVELGFPNIADDLILEYADDDTDPTNAVYPYVPIEVVDQLIEKHGGLVGPEPESFASFKEHYGSFKDHFGPDGDVCVVTSW